jgi:hypothetical protein
VEELFSTDECGEKVLQCAAFGYYAALLAAFGVLACSASSHFTDTSFETPGSCIVTP